MSRALFGGTSAPVNKPAAVATALRVQSSVQGQPIPIVYGTVRLGVNLLWYGDFFATSIQQGNTSGGGGKGTIFSGAGSAQPQLTVVYYVSAVYGICEGPVGAFLDVWSGKQLLTVGQASTPGGPNLSDGFLGMTVVSGSYSQGAWGYLASRHPSQALTYRGTAYAASGPIYLGDKTELPNISMIVEARADGGPDASGVGAKPFSVISDFITSDKYGAGFPASRLDAGTLYSQYCTSLGFVFSVAIVDQRPASDYLKEWAQGTNSEYVWTSGVLKIVPYGDTAVGTYVPPAFSPYTFTDVDYIAKNTADPVVVKCKREEDVGNAVRVEYLDGISFNFNPAIHEIQEDAYVNLFGLNQMNTVQWHFYANSNSTAQGAALLLGREQILNTYEFTVAGCYILLDPMDIVEITDSALGIQSLPIRIKEITENDDYTLTIVAEDYPAGAAQSPAYSLQPNAGASPNYNVSSGNVLTPLIFEPTDQLANGLEIWVAVTGTDLTVWGGCEIWASYDGLTYQRIGVQRGPSRMGLTQTQLTSFSPPPQGANIDNSQTLGIDLTISGGKDLGSASLSDFLAYNSAFYIDGEYIGYEDAGPTGTYTYNLAPLIRAGFGSSSGSHSSGVPCVRLDDTIFKFPYTQDRIGATINLKFLSFNNYGGGKQGLADVGPYTYTIQGTALSSPLPDVKNFVSVYVGNITYLDWDIVTDFRPVQYEIRKGPTWEAGQTIGVFAHPHIPAVGDSFYFIKAVSQPAAGLTVYSADATQINVVGSVLALNLLQSNDEGPTGGVWPGTLSGAVTNDGTFIHTLTLIPFIPDTAPLTLTSISPSTFNAPNAAHRFPPCGVATLSSVPPTVTGGPAAVSTLIDGDGYYTIPASHIINVGRLAPTLVQIIWDASGGGTTDFFHPGAPNDADFFAHSDVFDSAANRFIDVQPEISISTDGVNFGPFQKYKAGFYNIWKINARVHLRSTDPTNVEAFLTRFVFTAYAQTRVDHPLVNSLIPAIGQTITFAPDGQAATPFISGPNGGTSIIAPGVIVANPALPGTQVLVTDRVQGDDEILSSLSLSGCFLQIFNAGSPVARHVTFQAWGF